MTLYRRIKMICEGVDYTRLQRCVLHVVPLKYSNVTPHTSQSKMDEFVIFNRKHAVSSLSLTEIRTLYLTSTMEDILTAGHLCAVGFIQCISSKGKTNNFHCQPDWSASMHQLKTFVSTRKRGATESVKSLFT